MAKLYAAVHNEFALQETLKTTEKDNFKKGDKAFTHLFLSFCLRHSEKEETQAMFSWGSWGDPALLFTTVYWVHWIKKDLVPLVWAHLRKKLF